MDVCDNYMVIYACTVDFSVGVIFVSKAHFDFHKGKVTQNTCSKIMLHPILNENFFFTKVSTFIIYKELQLTYQLI